MHILFGDTELGQGRFNNLVWLASQPVMGRGRDFILWGTF